MAPSRCSAQSEAQPASENEPPAPPTDPNTERARRLFREGVSHADGRRWALAAARFREALALKNAPAIRYNLASALIEMNQFRDAFVELDTIITDESANEDLKSTARQAQADLRGRSAELRVTDPAVTRVDGQFLPSDYGDNPWFLPAGEHVIERVRFGQIEEQRVVRLAGASVTTIQWDVAEWESRQVELPVDAVPALTRRPPSVDFLAPDEAAAETLPWGTIAIAGAGAAIIVAVGVAVAAASDGGPVPTDLGPRIAGPFGVSILSF